MGAVAWIGRTLLAGFLGLACLALLQPSHASDRYIDAVDDPGRWVIGNALAQALINLELRAASGGYTEVPEGRTIRPGERSVAVAFLDQRLRESGDLTVSRADREFFDPTLEQAVHLFQTRHGLEVDGLVGRRTLAALNTPVERVIERVLVNLNREESAPDVSTGKAVVVNLPEYRLRALEDGAVALAMDVIIGRRTWETPVLSTEITHLILNPTWTVPPGILTRTIAPAILEGQDYLGDNELELLSPVVEVTEIDWQHVADGALTHEGELLRFRQAPGPGNPLGRYRFHMPNRDHIFLHDTNQPGLLRNHARALSAGCVRLADPQALAAFVAGDHNDAYWRRYDQDPNWQYRWIVLDDPVPVHLVYHTVWVDDLGTLHVRPDVYGWDRTAIASLRASATTVAG